MKRMLFALLALLILIGAPRPASAQKISALPAATQPPGPSDVGIFDIGGTTQKVTAGQIQGVVCQGAVQVSHTGDTTEFTLKTCTVPAGLMGANGSIHVEALFSHTSNADTKTPRIRFGGTVVAGQAVSASSASSKFGNTVRNRNAQNSQVFLTPLLVGPYTAGTSAGVSTSAIDTSAAVSVTFTCQLGTSTDTCSLESYEVTVLPSP